jgi:hypothetical protein
MVAMVMAAAAAVAALVGKIASQSCRAKPIQLSLAQAVTIPMAEILTS